MGAFASTGYYFVQAYKTSVSMGLDMIDLSVVSPTMIIVSAVLFVLGLIVFVYISGYEFNILKFSISKNNELPAFNDYVGILKDGLKMKYYWIIYFGNSYNICYYCGIFPNNGDCTHGGYGNTSLCI